MSDHDAQPVAGWYDNPEGEGQRYWDGRQWTDQYRDSRWNPVAQVERLSSQLFTTLFVAKELSTLPGYLQEGEDLRHMVWGFYNGGHVGLVAATDRRVLFLSAGILGRTEFEDLPFTKISSVQQSSGLLTASITVYATGAKAGFSGMNKGQANAIADYIRSRMRMSRTEEHPQSVEGETPHSTPNQGPDITDQIRRLAQLRDEGLLTDEEFETKKRQFLGL